MKKTKQCWSDMKQRCLNKNNKAYPRYGGRGISICQEWIDSFDNFLADMGQKPEGMSIDRIDNDGCYCKENCRWANAVTQTRNRNVSQEGGIHFDERDKRWVVQISVASKQYHIGSFENIDEARIARDNAKQSFWEENANPKTGRSLKLKNTSGYVGVHFAKRDKKWVAYFGGRNGRKHIGSYATPLEANNARNEYLHAHGIGG